MISSLLVVSITFHSLDHWYGANLVSMHGLTTFPLYHLEISMDYKSLKANTILGLVWYSVSEYNGNCYVQ